jgi:hypothetical protein
MTTEKYISPKIKYSRLKIFFLNYYFLFGLIFFIIGFIGAINISRTYKSTYVDKENLTKKTHGLILDTEKIFQDAGETYGSFYYKYKYSYHIDDSLIFVYGSSDNNLYKIGDTITVFYDFENPTLSIVENLKETQLEEDDAILIWILPIVGLIIIIYSFFWCKKIFRLLDNGLLTNGVHYSTEKNDDPESGGFIHQYVFTDDKGRKRKVKKHTIWRDEKENEVILFDKIDKTNQITLSDLSFLGNKKIKVQIYSSANIV